MKLITTLFATAISAIAMTGCDRDRNSEISPQIKRESTEATQAAPQTLPAPGSADPAAIAQANRLFEDFFQEHLSRSPQFMTFLGVKEDYGKWDDLSPEFAQETHDINLRQLATLNKLDPSKLDDATYLSLQLAKRKLEQEIEAYKWRLHSYPVNQMYAVHTGVASLLINQHRIDNADDAEAYIARLNALPAHFDQLQKNLEACAEAGTIVPKFVFPYVISDARNLITGAPFDDGDDSTLFADFKGKVEQLAIDSERKEQLVGKAKSALLSSAGPAYRKLIAYLQQLEKRATTDDGVWKLANGDEFYAFKLRQYTTTDLSADEIHEIGLQEVARIHGEMREIMQRVAFDGSLQDFFEFMRTDEQFYYPNTADGKQRYLEKATEIIDTMKGRLDELFITKPKADLIVKAVEPFREKSAGKAFYQRPAPDGSRPGIYYANLYNTKNMPTYQMEALAYHEGIPGHHMQLSIAQELEGIPKFRKFGSYTAYTEGWGLYAELVPKEMGFYQDPYSDFGRLAMELWRAGRLVVDTGIHSKRWTREEAINYLLQNTPNPKGDVVKAIERYIVMPGQATAYKIGMLKIVELREKAKQALGDQFDIRQFHDTVLANGAVPLDILEVLVERWIEQEKQR
ncbi:Uncharacterized conserved protein, DUF885 familyt [Microbulbifer thermotolerans]|uniref:DUF885 domain-containing protein n=1 Tax=Microbulbifer thermotolerans TaxID=252514 RepID=UPI0008E734E1|nr:DUF885 domain-containing protein [Microbulbifer thermotolerans]MCX2834563.1 DUF885 domain-containing protein [Microbulbifer thermotolerans]SFC72080.1 Uncharacterized conserved protein, DUF885 familyt [Microbulbifer thermotolerans]